jgi:hypothetical protein
LTSFRWFSPDISENPSRYDLLFYISENSCSFSVYDDVQRSITGFCEFGVTLAEENNAISILKKSIETEPLLSLKFKSCKACFHGDKNTLIPADLFESKSVHEYFDWVTDWDDKEILVYDFIKNADAFNVFSIRKKLFKKLNETFINPKILELNSVIIYNLLRENKGTRDKKIFVYVENQSLHIYFIDNGKLIFANRFFADTEEDFVYYILAVCEQLQLNTHAIQVCLLGDIDTDSSNYKLLAAYMEQISFIDFPKGIYMAQPLQQLPAHRFHHLFALALCE